MTQEPRSHCLLPLWRRGWFTPVLVGLVWRLIAAASGFGWFAIDDYAFVVEKAATWSHDPAAPFGCDYRNTLLPRALARALSLGHHLVGADPAYALQVAYALLGIVSVGTIVAVYHAARLGAGAKAARTSAWLAAAYVIMPRICTRALIESAAMLPVALSVWALMQGVAFSRAQATSQSRRWTLLCYALSAFLCGIGAMLRFQVGVLVVPMAIWTLWPTGRRLRGAWGRAASFTAGGLVAVVAQCAWDLREHRAPLSTIILYIDYNLHNASRYGVSPAYTYVLQCVMLSLPPASLLLGGAAWRYAWAQQRLACSLCLWFVATHSAIAHKEDRFLFPMLPMLFVVLGTALASPDNAVVGRRRRQRLGRLLFWSLNTLGLVVCSFSDAQRNWTQPLLRIARQTPPNQVRKLVVIEPDVVPIYYLGGRAKMLGYPNVAAFYDAALQSDAQVDYVLLRAAPNEADAMLLAKLGCGHPERFEGDAVDRLLVYVNRHNLRRAATTLLRCVPVGRGPPTTKEVL